MSRDLCCAACVQGIIDYGEAHKHITATLQTLISQVRIFTNSHHDLLLASILDLLCCLWMVPLASHSLLQLAAQHV